jgi:hypothetical protein
MKMLEHVNRTNGSQRDWDKDAIILFLCGFSFAQGQPRSVANMQDANFIVFDVEENAVFVLSPPMQNLADLTRKTLAFRRKRATLRESVQ